LPKFYRFSIHTIELLFLVLSLNCGGAGKGELLTISPSSVILTTWDKQQFTASADVYWDVEEPGGGFFDGSEGLYTASYKPGTYHVVAKKKSDKSKTANALVRVVDPPDASITSPSVVNHDTQGIKASVREQVDSTYTWTLSGAEILKGQNSSSITFNSGVSGSCIISCTVTNKAGKSDTRSSTIRIAAQPTIESFSASPAIVDGGDSTRVTATFSHGTATIDSLGSIESGIAYSVAPPVTQAFTLHVTNEAGEEVSRSLTITVNSVVKTLDPTPVLVIGGSLKPHAMVLGSLDHRLAWSLLENQAGGRLTDTLEGILYRGPVQEGRFRILASALDNTEKNVTISGLVVSPFDASLNSGFAKGSFLPMGIQPTNAGWSRHSRFQGPVGQQGPRQEWVVGNTYNSYDPLIAEDGSLLFADSNALIKVDQYGRKIWATSTGGPEYMNVRHAFAIDAKGRVLCLGGDRNGVWVFAFSEIDGTLSWRARVNWDQNSHERPVIDSLGRIAVTDDARSIILLDDEGSIQWQKYVDFPGSLIFTQQGDLISFSNRYIIKIDPQGNTLWTTQTEAAGSVIYGAGEPRLGMGNDGTLYAGYHRLGQSWRDQDCGIIAFNNDGTTRWISLFPQNASLPMYDQPRPFFAIANDGTIICSNHSRQLGLLALNPDGKIKWQFFQSSEDPGVGFSAPIIGRDGTIYAFTRPDPFSAKGSMLYAVNPDGTLLWKRPLAIGIELGDAGATGLTLGPKGQLYVHTAAGLVSYID